MKKLYSLMLLAGTLMMFTGCAAIQHRNLDVQTQVSQTIFANPDVLSEDKPIYLRITNQTGQKDLSLENLVSMKLQGKGYKVTKNAKEAGYRLMGNFLYLDKAKQGMSGEGALAGGYGGALLGALATSGSGTSFGKQAGVATLAGLAGAGAGALIGAVVHVDTWYGIVDIQIEEPLLGGPVEVTTRAKSGQGSLNAGGQNQKNSKGWSASAGGSGTAEESEMEFREKVNHKKMQTRIVSEAKQTNIDEGEAKTQIAEQLSDAIANFF